MKNFLKLLLMTFVLISCDGHRTQWRVSETLSEQGTVVAKEFKGESVTHGSSVGITTNGELSIGSVTLHETEKFNVVFRCDHGHLFTINDPRIYEKVKEQDNVVIVYQEKYKNGKFYDFIFLDATAIKNKDEPTEKW